MGSIKLDMLIDSKNCLSQYRIGKYNITSDMWLLDSIQNVYYVVLPTYTDIVVLGLYSNGIEYIHGGITYNSNDIVQIQSIDNTISVTVLFIYKEDESIKTDDIFYPKTKASQVIFNDGQSLEDKLTNNLLYRNTHIDERDKWRYYWHVTTGDFIENRTSFICQITKDIHNLGDSVIVTSILKQLDSGVLQNIAPSITYDGGKITIEYTEKFNGTIIIEAINKVI